VVRRVLDQISTESYIKPLEIWSVLKAKNDIALILNRISVKLFAEKDRKASQKSFDQKPQNESITRMQRPSPPAPKHLHNGCGDSGEFGKKKKKRGGETFIGNWNAKVELTLP
jgi:hypothetical protein